MLSIEEKKRRKHEYYINHKEEHEIRTRKYNIEHKDEIRIWKKMHHQVYKKENKFKCLKHYSLTDYPSCVCCKNDNFDVLTIDHIDHKTKDKTIKRLGLRMYIWLIKNNFPEGFQTLCHNCNSGKHCRGLCPHELTEEYLNDLFINDHYKYQRIPILKKFSNGKIKCNYCNEDNILFLAIDHVNGGGSKQIKDEFNGKKRRYNIWLRDEAPISDFQVLCHNCNFLKRLGKV